VIKIEPRAAATGRPRGGMIILIPGLSDIEC